MSVGKSLVDYDSMIVLTHFKGHAAGGFGGSLKNIAIGCADAKIGKAMQHGGADFPSAVRILWNTWLKPAKP